MSFSYNSLQALNKIINCGHQAFFVGGCVRDYIINRSIYDIDIATSATPSQILNIFKDNKCLLTGIKYGTVTVIINEEQFEITTFRTDNTYTDKRHPDSVTYTTDFKIDCQRRDFTINAIGYNPTSGYIDYFDGINDINNNIVKCVGDPNERFQEDPLRIIRGIRFCAVLGFNMEENTKQAAKNLAYLLLTLPKERITQELLKLLTGDFIKQVLIEYIDILSIIIPCLLPMKNFNQNNYHHIHDVLTHTAIVVENTPPIAYLRLASLMHDTGKPYTYTVDEKGIGHFYNHNSVSLALTIQILEKISLSSKLQENIKILVRDHDVTITPTEKSVKKALNKYGYDVFFDLINLKKADNLGQNISEFNRQDEYNQIISLADKIISENQCFNLNSLCINGNDLINIGIPKGKDIGVILNQLLNKVIDEDLVNEKEILLDYALSFYKTNFCI